MGHRRRKKELRAYFTRVPELTPRELEFLDAYMNSIASGSIFWPIASLDEQVDQLEHAPKNKRAHYFAVIRDLISRLKCPRSVEESWEE